MRRILCACVLRNPTIGYCQGMNNIVAKLIVHMAEEDAFWTFCCTIEQILPLDYYSNMLGVLVEQQVLEHLMAQHFKPLQDHLMSKGVYIALLMLEWLICLFINNVSKDLEIFILDLFYLGGVNDLLRSILTVISMMEQELIESQDMVQMTLRIQQGGKDLAKDLVRIRMWDVSNQVIDNLRTTVRSQILSQNQKKFETTQKSQNL